MSLNIKCEFTKLFILKIVLFSFMCPRAEKRYARDYTDEELHAQARDIECAVTIPVNVEIEVDHRVLDLGEMEKVLRKARRIGLQDCGCRTEKRNCGAPMHVCISIDPATDYTAKFAQYNAHECTLDEALDALRTSHEGGLVHMAYTMKGEDRVSLVCSCCSCCCPTLGGLLRHGIATQVLTSRFIAEQNYDKCKACRKCADRCVFGARHFKEDKLQYDPSR